MIPAQLFTTFFYQPLFNILVFFYWVIQKIDPTADMGFGVILLTILIRILLLPLSLSGDKSEKERRQIAATAKEIEELYPGDPVRQRKEVKHLFRSNRKVVVGELISLGIQVSIALALWRIFARGLMGADLHLIYPWMPDVQFPYNMMFLGKFSLNEPHWQLNIIQSLLIFIFETLNIFTSPYPTTKEEVVRLQITLPLVSFMIFSQLPAGKKLFVIVTLIFSIILKLIRYTKLKFSAYKDKVELKQNTDQSEQIIVDVK